MNPKASKKRKTIDAGEGTSLIAPKGKKGKRPIEDLNNFDKCALRRIIHTMYAKEKKAPKLKLICKKFQDAMRFKGSLASIDKNVKEIGFNWHKIKPKRKILLEKPRIICLRVEYFRNISSYRNEGRPIIYMKETYVNSGDSANVLIYHAGCENGFLQNAGLIRSLHQKDKKFTNYKRWLGKTLIPNLPPRSVLIIDDCAYHRMEIDKSPNSNSAIDEMRDWLTDRNVAFTNNMFKIELFELIKTFKPKHKTYEIDNLLAKFGHNVLRLPPIHQDLNPIELVWYSLQSYVASRNVTLKSDDVKSLCEQWCVSLQKDEWKVKCQHVKKIEQSYMSNESLVEDVIEEIICNSDDDSSSDEELESEDDSDDN